MVHPEIAADGSQRGETVDVGERGVEVDVEIAAEGSQRGESVDVGEQAVVFDVESAADGSQRGETVDVGERSILNQKLPRNTRTAIGDRRLVGPITHALDRTRSSVARNVLDRSADCNSVQKDPPRFVGTC